WPPWLLAGLCTLVALLWVACCHEESWAGLRQDGLGLACFLLVWLTALRDGACFLLALLALDVFFVLVNPLLAKAGKSVMEEGTTGPVESPSRERLPTVLRGPRLGSSALRACEQPFSILSLEGIVVLGFLAASCHRLDVQVHSHGACSTSCTVACAMGLLVTFTAGLLMMGQPALLYPVSSALL
ncbi:signal peptide peptidase-like 2C, partial [Carlito syrichta]|uniref:Signal peptide peptidase-like 2C n=1 Tax=Carlito syrichta TaxID=1868482 RepID=A0A3Q0DSE1_CARSF